MTEIIARAEVPGANARGDRFEIIIQRWFTGPQTGYRYGVGSYLIGNGPLKFRLRAGETVFTDEPAARAEANRQWTAHKDEFAKNQKEN